MTDIAGVARELAIAMKVRARTRAPEDLRKVLELQTLLCQVVEEENEVGILTSTEGVIHSD
jgi:hypothetical protein